MEVIEREALFMHKGINFLERRLGVWGLVPEKFSKITCSRMSENALLRSRKMFFAIDLHSGMGSMIPSSNLHCTNTEDTKL